MLMNKSMKLFVVTILLLLTSCQAMSSDLEPKCSKYHFEEHLLEKMVKVEHKTGSMIDSFNEQSSKVNTELAAMKAGIEEHEKEQKNSFLELFQQIQSEHATMKKDLEEMKQTLLEQWNSANETFQKDYSEFKEMIDQPSYAFSATDLSAARPSVGDVLVFTKTLLDEHGVYNNQTGMFTAPVNGLYMFSVTLNARRDKYVYVELRAGGTSAGKFRTGDTKWNSVSSGSALVRLQKGIDVYLKVLDINTGFVFWEDHRFATSFSGHLIERKP